MSTSRHWTKPDLETAFFNVDLRPVFIREESKGMHYTELQRYQVVFDTDRNRPFAVVTDDYALITNRQAFEMATGIMKEVFSVLTIDDMECLNIIMPQTRSYCHIDLIHKHSHFTHKPNDKWTSFLRITNSYNKTKRLRFEVGFCRWICLNGMIFGNRSVEFSYAHSRGDAERINRFIENVADIRIIERSFTDSLRQLEDYNFSEKKMLTLLCKVFKIRIDPSEILDTEKKAIEMVSLRELVGRLTEEYFGDFGENGYAALNVLTDYATHSRDSNFPRSRIHGQQQDVGQWLEEFIQEVQSSSFSLDDYLDEYRETADLIRSA
jgi:Domain of unknown function (DUF932)